MHRVTVPALGFRNRIVQEIEVGKQQTLRSGTRNGHSPLGVLNVHKWLCILITQYLKFLLQNLIVHSQIYRLHDRWTDTAMHDLRCRNTPAHESCGTFSVVANTRVVFDLTRLQSDISVTFNDIKY